MIKSTGTPATNHDWTVPDSTNKNRKLVVQQDTDQTVRGETKRYVRSRVARVIKSPL